MSSVALVVTRRTGGLGTDLELLLELLAEIFGGFDGRALGNVSGNILVAVVEIEDLLERAQVLLGSAVAIKAPTHGVRFGLIDHFHLVDVTVTTLA